jgi:hypothetical protein
MTTQQFLPLGAAALLAASLVPLRVSDPAIAVAEASPRIVELAPVIVHPAVEDAAYYQSRKIVDLPAVVVTPAAADHASFLASAALDASLACRC